MIALIKSENIYKAEFMEAYFGVSSYAWFFPAVILGVAAEQGEIYIPHTG